MTDLRTALAAILAAHDEGDQHIEGWMARYDAAIEAARLALAPTVKICNGGDYAKEAAAMLQRWPVSAAPSQYERTIDRAKACGAVVTQHEIGFTHAEFEKFLAESAAPMAGVECDHLHQVWGIGMKRGHCKDCGVGLGDAAPIPPQAVESAALQAAEWQPIATAPKDGTVVLGYRDGRYAMASRVPRDDCEMWTFGSRTAAVEYVPEIKPTHWKPLPPPPAAMQPQPTAPAEGEAPP